MSFLEALETRVRPGLTIGFPEADEPRTIEAVALLAATGRPIPVLVRDSEAVGPGEVSTFDPDLRRAALEAVPDLSAPGEGDGLRFALGLLRAGRLDGVVAGASATTAEVLRSGLQVVGTAPGIRTVSGAFYMVVPPRAGDPERVLTFADAAVVPEPTLDQLVEIAEAACDARVRVVGDEPRVAFLSFSTRGSAGGASPERMRRAAARFAERRPTTACDGEIQADAALVPEVARRKAPGSSLAGRANVLVFPDLDAGNIAYKLVQRLGGAVALGPILQGLAAPLNDLSRGASSLDIVHVTRITALMAGPAGGTECSEGRPAG